MLLVGSTDAILAAAAAAATTTAGPAPTIVKRDKTTDDLGIIIGLMIQIGHLEKRVKISASAPPPGRGHGGRRRTQAAGGTAAAGAPVAAAVLHGMAAAPIRRRGAKRRRRRAGGMGMGSSMPPSLPGSSSSSSAGAAAAAGYADHAAMLTIIAVGAEDSRGEGVAIVARRAGRQRRPRWVTIRACHCNCRAFAPHESSAKRAQAPPFVAFPALQAKRIDHCQIHAKDDPLHRLRCCAVSRPSSPWCFGPIQDTPIADLFIYLQIDQGVHMEGSRRQQDEVYLQIADLA